ncbi:protein disulfide-isomerase A3-like [Corticium candelabrum]|uniref:protein disulfide-isomerase A3-like n=1 Tax=Corticium candelabrum TaxID=121492 RepID=UPI002E2598B0|nr:protein disulfide-isomerase A3-like [Corticium candelabrum]
MAARLLLVFALVYLVVGDGDVLELTDSTFKDEVKKHDIILVEFFAPWCGHCKRLAPEYEGAATELLSTDPPVPLAKVDCTAEKDTCSNYGVSGYPTLKIFRNGELASDYNGPREKDGIVKYMVKQAAPSAKELTSVEEVRKFLDNDEHSILGFFAQEDGLYKVFTKTADSMREEFRFGYSSAADVLEEYGYQSAVVLFQPSRLQNKLEKAQSRYSGKEDIADLKKWIKATFPGLVGFITPDIEKLFTDKRPLVTVYFNVDYKLNPKGTNYWRNRILKVAKDFTDLQFAMADTDDFGHTLSQTFGVESGSKKDALTVTVVDANDKKYRMDGDFSVDNFRAFVQQYLDGGVEPYIKSEPIPETNDDPVKVVVAKNFDAIVNDPTKDVLIEFYAPWCGHCKTLAPKYDELAQKLVDDPNIVIAKMDATANDAQKGYDVQGFPTLYWAPIGKKDSPRKYEGGREVTDFLSFIKKEATNPPVINDKKKSKEDL